MKSFVKTSKITAILLCIILLFTLSSCSIKHTYVFENSTFTLDESVVIGDVVIESMSITLMKIDDEFIQTNSSNTIINKVTNEPFSIKIKMKAHGLEKQLIEFFELSSGPEPMRPNRYFAIIDMTCCGLGKIVCKFEFQETVNSAQIGVYLFDYSSQMSFTLRPHPDNT